MIPLTIALLVLFGAGTLLLALALRETARDAAAVGRRVTARRVVALGAMALVAVSAFTLTAQQLGRAVAAERCNGNISSAHVLEAGAEYAGLHGEGGAAVSVERDVTVCLSFVDGRPM